MSPFDHLTSTLFAQRLLDCQPLPCCHGEPSCDLGTTAHCVFEIVLALLKIAKPINTLEW
jgi:hypothetical protein